jgi:cytochrome c oxidase subunit 2
MTSFWNRAARGGQALVGHGLVAPAVLALAVGLAMPALAGTGEPTLWEMNMQHPATEVAQDINSLHDALLWIITAISLFVLGLLIAVMVKFNEKANPVPSKTTHHTGLEIAWTVIPALILVGIAIPSFRLLKLEIEVPKADVAVKAIGHQWYWSYEYPTDQGGGFTFDSYMLTREEAQKANLPALLAVDNELVVPAGKTVVLQVTGADVIHNFAVTSFGIRMDAIPGRANQTWFKTDREGVYYGQCSRLCGANHAFMPIAIRVVSPEKYAAWLVEAKKKFASNDTGTVQVAARPATVE